MMNSIVEIHPKELKFVVELKKQSSCSIRLTNKSDHHVAFKVKTTSPKKYCVRPNVGVISPKSVCEFSVTMQAPKTALPDMDCKDKFLIQSTAVSSETTDADITASMFAKDEGKYVEERKLRVILISPPNSPILSPIKGDLKQGQVHEASVLDNQVFGGVETVPQHKMVTGDVKFRVVNSEESKPTKESEVKPAKHVELEIRQEEELTQGKDVGLKLPKYEELEAIKDVESKATNAVHIEPAKDVELKSAKVVELEPAKDMNAKIVESKSSEDLLLKLSKDVDADKAQVVEGLKLVKDIKEMKSKLLELEFKLSQAQVTISTLTEERGSSIQEIKDLKEQLGHLSKGGVQRVEFPVIIGCTVALFSVLLVTAIAIKSLCMKVASSL
ncbi:vesicle-associated protein 2-2-like [Argentina anserina]|uniref:vesicle-associated protein 2-2-like n=1 Tax=Argentina anserina TaxID=57926 RepID=UPI0021762F82|nr:vesicle-associated protein 2-2-like [Potentilla anserina]